MKSLSEKRQAIRTDIELSQRAQCQILGIHRSGLYYENRGESALNLKLMEHIDRRFHYHPYEGVPRMLDHLRLDLGYEVSRNRVERLFYDVMCLRAIIPGPHTSKRNKQHKVYPYLLRNLKIETPNQVWATDITYMPLPRGFMYLTAVMDLYSRYVLSWSVSNTMESEWCRRTLEAAQDQYGNPGILNTDQGSQYTSKEYSEYVLGQGIQLSMDGVGRATDNAFVERLWRTVKYENVRFSDYSDGLKLCKGMDDYFPGYNQRRHSSLGKMTPKQLYFER